MLFKNMSIDEMKTALGSLEDAIQRIKGATSAKEKAILAKNDGLDKWTILREKG